MIKISRELSLELGKALTGKEVREWIRKVEEEVGGLTWPSIGGLRNNSLACDLASGPMPALIERVTNGQDAVVENGMVLASLTGILPEPKSPREAVSILFGIDDEMDSTPHAILADVASKLVVSLHDGSEHQTPTCIIRDKGIGQHPSRFPATLLSLCSDNKTDKPWLHGRYNAGSSASYKFASATIVTSRRNPDLAEEADEVGTTVVLHDPRRRPGPCVYMADKNEEILRLDLPEFDHGTEIKLVDYDLPKHNAKADHATNSLRQAFFAHFVRPSMPFCISENRDSHGKNGNHLIYGLYHALDGRLSVQKSAGLATRPPICALKSPPYEIPLGKLGRATLRCFVLHEAAKQRYYVNPDQAFCFSLNGQRQHNKERSWFRELGFNNIYQRMICVVECDGIDYDERHEIFKSDREGIVDSPTSRLILERAEHALRNDPDLQRLEEEAKEDKIKNAAGKVGEKTLSEIKRLIGGMNLKGSETHGATTGTRTPPSGRPRSTDDSHLPDLPTSLKIEKDPFNAARGSGQRLYVNLDCKNSYLPGPGRKIELILSENIGKVVGFSGLSGGSVRFDIKMKEDAPAGEHDILALFMDEPNGIRLWARGVLNITEPRERDEESEPKKNTNAGNADRNVQVHWVAKASWPIHGWDEDSVGECQEEADGGITFFLNRNNRYLELAADTGKFTEDSWENFLEKFSLPVTTGLYGIRKDESAATRERIENEKRRILQAAIISIRPELVHDAAMESKPRTAHSIPAMEAKHRNPPNTHPAEPRRDLRQNLTFQLEMAATQAHRSRK